MKKFSATVSVILAFMMLCACTAKKETNGNSSAPYISQASSSEETSSVTTVSQAHTIVPANDSVIAPSPDITSYSQPPVQNTESAEFRGVWLAIYELSPKSKTSTENEYKEKIDLMMKNLNSIGTTDAFVQVRANCDSIYPSQYFKPYSSFEKDGKIIFDALKIIVASAHEHGIKVHAWINPYRISSTDGVSDTDPIYGFVEKSDIYTNGKKAHLKPCSEKAKKLVLDGIREILAYDVDGVHIDDYFYPDNDTKIDESEYSAYLSAGGSLSLPDWRRANVSSLVSSIYSLVKSTNTNKIFSISPAGDIDKNKDTLYADVELWCSTYGYTDMIIPQIYYGFENEKQPFKKCLDRWKNSVKSDSVKLVIGLAVYKAGETDEYAGKGENEWKNSSDIIKRQVEYLRKNDCDGYALFSYHHVFSDSESIKAEINNLKSVLN